MEPEVIAQLLQLGTFGTSTATAVILYKMHRDNRDHVQTHRLHWYWLRVIRHRLWPDTFQAPNGEEPHHEPQ